MKLSHLALITSLALGFTAAIHTSTASAQTADGADDDANVGQPGAPGAQEQPGHGGRRGARATAPAQTSGTIVRYVQGRQGRTRGFVLNNGIRVMMRPRLAEAMQAQVQPGTAVTVSGFTNPERPQVIRRSTVTTATGAVFAPRQGGGGRHRRHQQPAQAEE